MVMLTYRRFTQHRCKYILQLLNIYGDTMKINTKITILLLLLITIGVIYIFFFTTTEKQIYHNLDIDIPFSDLKIIEKHNSYGDNFSHDGESLYLITSKKNLRSATKNWAKLPQKEILVYLFGEIGYSMKESLALPNIKNGRYKFINKTPNKKDYDFIICIYNEDNNEIYYVKFDT